MGSNLLFSITMSKQSLWKLGKEFERYSETVRNYEIAQRLITVEKPKIAETLQATRETVGMVLMSDDETPQFAFQKQTGIKNKPDGYYRKTLFGGGIQTKEQQNTKDDREDFDFHYLAEGLESSGTLRPLTYDFSSKNLQSALEKGVMERLEKEADGGIKKVRSAISDPTLLSSEPLDSHLTSIKIPDDDQKKRIIEKWGERKGFSEDEKKRLAGICLTVRERFAKAVVDVQKLKEVGSDHIEIVNIDELRKLVQESHADANVSLQALEDGDPESLKHLEAWKNRPAGSIRNSSLLAGVAAALKASDKTWSASLKRCGESIWKGVKNFFAG